MVGGLADHDVRLGFRDANFGLEAGGIRDPRDVFAGLDLRPDFDLKELQKHPSCWSGR